MATRNRTSLFKRERDALRQARRSALNDSANRRKEGSETVIQMVVAPLLSPYSPLPTHDINSSGKPSGISLPPAWVDSSKEITNDLQRARSKLVALSKAQAKALRPSFVDAEEDKHVVEALSQEISGLLKKCQKKLLSMGISSDETIRKNVQIFLASDLQSVSTEFRKKQSNYLEIMRQQDGIDGTDIGMDLNNKRNANNSDDFFDVGFTKQQMAKLKQNETFTIERETEVLQIVQSVNDLAQIMKDLSCLVIDQGTIVDRIDYNIQNVASSVDCAVKHLEKAERMHKKGGLVMCATVLIFMCLFMLIVLIVKMVFF